MAVKIKLMRVGKIRQPYYRIVVADARAKRDGRSIEEIGKYHPKSDPSFIQVDSERAQYWLGVGAQPTEPVAAILKVTGDWQKFRGEPGAEGTLRIAEVRPDKKVAFDAATKESAGEPAEGATTPRKRAAKKVAASTEKPSTEKPATEKPAPAAEAPAAEAPAAETPAAETPAAEAETPAAEAETPAAEAPAATDGDEA